MGIHAHDTVSKDITPQQAVQRLKDGNFRFLNNLKMNRDLLEQVNELKNEQWPFAAILSCMDSRTSAELIFDQGLGDIFSIRIAGNIISPGILGSLEYATGVVGSKLILVLGHTGCGAIKGACDDVEFGHLTSLLSKIKPAVEKENTVLENRNGTNPEFVNAVAKLNVHNSVNQIIHHSEVIKNLVAEGKIALVPAMYDVSTGLVTFYDDNIFLEDHQSVASVLSAD